MSLHVIVNNEIDFFSIQKAHVGYKFIDHAFKYASIPINRDLRSICKIIPKADVADETCILDHFVIQYTTLQHLQKLIFSKVTEGLVNKEDIRVYDSIVEARSIEVTVVLKNSTKVLKYKNDEELPATVRQLLCFYTIVNSSLIKVDDTKIKSDVNYILIHNAGSRKNVSRVGSSTLVNVKRIMSVDNFKQMCLDPSSFKVAGLSKQLDFLTAVYNAQVSSKVYGSRSENKAKVNQKILIIGPSGCGKTSLVKYFAQIKNCGLVTIESSSIASAEPGKSEKILKSLFDEAVNRSQEEKEGICIILLDQVENICGTKKSSALHLKRISHQLFHLLEEISDNPGVIVIGTTNNVHALDPAVRRADRLEIEIYIGVPTEPERQEILKLYCTNYGIKSTMIHKNVASLTPGYVGADLALLVREVNRTRCKDKSLYTKELDVMNLFQSCVTKHRPASLRSGLGIVRSGDVLLSDLGGLFEVKKSLQAFVEWPLKYPQAFSRLGIRVPKGILLYGPPGCAKTSLTCAIAHATNTNFLSLSAAELYSPYVGEAERNVIELFHKARVNSPCIIFIDEIDALVGDRNVSSKNVQEKILSAFLTEMDGVGNKIDSFSIQNMTETESQTKQSNKMIQTTVIVIAATNRPDKLDSALLRPGRFDKLLYIGAPDLQERIDILQTVTRTWKMPLDGDVDLQQVALRTENFTGADLASLVREAGFCALFEEGMAADVVKQKHIVKSLTQVQPSLKDGQLDYHDVINK